MRRHNIKDGKTGQLVDRDVISYDAIIDFVSSMIYKWAFAVDPSTAELSHNHNNAYVFSLSRVVRCVNNKIPFIFVLVTFTETSRTVIATEEMMFVLTTEDDSKVIQSLHERLFRPR